MLLIDEYSVGSSGLEGQPIRAARSAMTDVPDMLKAPIS